MKIVTLYAGEENTRYFAVHDRKHISPWCISPIYALWYWFKGERYLRTNGLDAGKGTDD